MKKILLVALLPTLLLTACNDGDGVPKLDDPHQPVVDGQKMTKTAFLEKYCIAKDTNETCIKVKHAVGQDMTRGKLPKGW